MKCVVILVVVFFCFLFGYFFEPKLRDSLTGEVKAPESEPVVEGVVKSEQPPQSAVEPEVEPEVEPAVEPAVDPIPTEDEKPVVAVPIDEIRQMMQHSIQQAEIHHFTIGQVTQWKDFGEEQIDGVNYQFGLIDYRENTIFGEREFEAKALIRNGKVEKWVWPINGMRIP